ncbi:hypothetical protein LTR05_002504 [Lithohypha guttulata]|uniref:FAD-binding domain-containing protein n=1 Tax=Lithohypha guttulata TaxID=1690604 RepID=A0AAN7T4R3_9EURO|nr:hypothetical protein LTR05_002504 [Lithohypha guttulata]
MSFTPDVIIAGAGPTGVFLACRIIRMGRRVLVLERDEVLQPAIRALGYYGPTQYALDKAGIYEAVRDRGFFQLSFSWRKNLQNSGPDEKAWGDLVAAWNPWEDVDMKPGDCGYGMLCLGQDKLRDICMAKLKAASESAQVLLGHTVNELVEDDNSVTVKTVDASGNPKEFKAPFVVGADGGKSTIRKLVGLSLEGYTWPYTIVAVDIYGPIYPPKDEPPLVYVLDKKHIAFFSPLEKVRYDGWNLYRFTLPMAPEDVEPSVFQEKLREKIDLLVPGKRPLHYEIRNAQPYRIHQRQVAKYKVGRTVLVGDAAHLNTPWGGLGLTTGILDADSLGDAFDMVLNEGKSQDVLEIWAKARHAVWKNIVDPISTNNQLRCHNIDPDRPKEDHFFKVLLDRDDELKQINESFDKQMITRMRDLVDRSEQPAAKI